MTICRQVAEYQHSDGIYGLQILGGGVVLRNCGDLPYYTVP